MKTTRLDSFDPQPRLPASIFHDGWWLADPTQSRPGAVILRLAPRLQRRRCPAGERRS
jgi:hypothetical protein